MRIHPALVLSACVSLSQFTGAVPSPSAVLEQESFDQNTQTPWRALADRVIEKIWGLDPSAPRAADRTRSQSEAPRIRTKSRHGQDLLLRFNISTAEEAKSLANVADFMYLDVWEYTEDWVDIRIAKDVLPHVLKTLPESLQHSHTALMQEKELAQAIYDTYPSPKKAPSSNTVLPPSRGRTFGPAPRSVSGSDAESNIFFTDYQPLSVIQPWLRLLASLFTTHVRLINIGITYEGRDIPALRVGVHPTNDDDPPSPRKTILITGGIHAREWISTSTVNYLAYHLITGYGKDTLVTKLLEDFDWVFIPTINPDGYAYSWETDRLWRKNRQQTALRFCHGVDLDRSFGFEWDGSSTQGNPCSESYAGSSAFEGVEAHALAEWARNETENNNVEFVGFLDLHSYSQQILYPYSYSCDAAPPGLENLLELAAGLAKAIRIKRGHAYQSAPACEGNVAASSSKTGASGNETERNFFPRFESGGGSALDYFYNELRVHYTYQIKLRDRGSYGFLLPKEHIVPTGKEMLEAVLYFGRYLSSVFELSQKGLSLEMEDEDEQEAREKKEQEQGREDAWRLGPGRAQAEDGFEVRIAGENIVDPVGNQGDLKDESEDAWWELKRRR